MDSRIITIIRFDYKEASRVKVEIQYLPSSRSTITGGFVYVSEYNDIINYYVKLLILFNGLSLNTVMKTSFSTLNIVMKTGFSTFLTGETSYGFLLRKVNEGIPFRPYRKYERTEKTKNYEIIISRCNVDHYSTFLNQSIFLPFFDSYFERNIEKSRLILYIYIYHMYDG